MFCTKCGNEFSENINFCENCGNAREEITEKSVADSTVSKPTAAKINKHGKALTVVLMVAIIAMFAPLSWIEVSIDGIGIFEDLTLGQLSTWEISEIRSIVSDSGEIQQNISIHSLISFLRILSMLADVLEYGSVNWNLTASDLNEINYVIDVLGDIVRAGEIALHIWGGLLFILLMGVYLTVAEIKFAKLVSQIGILIVLALSFGFTIVLFLFNRVIQESDIGEAIGDYFNVGASIWVFASIALCVVTFIFITFYPKFIYGKS